MNNQVANSVRLSDELVQVRLGDRVVGFVECAGPVFVALHGSRYDRAVEVAQSLVLEDAAGALLAHVRMVARVSDELEKPLATQHDGAHAVDHQRIA